MHDETPSTPVGAPARDVAAICAAVAVVGLSFGALASAAGLPLHITVALSLLVFAGGSQFMVVAVIAAGGSPWTAVLGGLLINARHLPFGLAISSIVGPRLGQKLLGAHLLVDEVVAFSRSQQDPARAHKAYWMCGIGLAISWNISAFVGAVAGGVVPDPELFGIDAAFPAALLALVLPGLRGRSQNTYLTRRVAIAGSLLALLATPFLPPGLPVLASLAALPLTLGRGGGKDTP